MPVKVYEGIRSRAASLETESAGKTVELVAIGSTSEDDVIDAVLLTTPLYAFGPGGIAVPLRRDSLKCNHKGGGIWSATVEYKFTRQAEQATQDNEDGDPVGIEWTFDGTGATAHVTQSVQTRFARARGDDVSGLDPVPTPPPNPPPESGMGKAPNHQRAIGVTLDRVEGCDITVPRMEVTATLNYIGLTWGQVRSWGRLTGKTNKLRWKGFEVGELLYLGPSGNIQPAQLAKATHRFAFGEILEKGDPALVIDPRLLPNGIVLPRKRPFDYVWCGYDFAADAGQVVRRPAAAYVEQVYREGDFSALGLGS